MSDLEVAWDGVNRGDDSDLLCAPKLPIKRDAPPLTSAVIQHDRGSASVDLVEQCLHPPCTKPVLLERTGLTASAVGNALYRLVEMGVVHVVGEAYEPGRRWTRKRLKVYGVRKEAA